MTWSGSDIKNYYLINGRGHFRDCIVLMVWLPIIITEVDGSIVDNKLVVYVKRTLPWFPGIVFILILLLILLSKLLFRPVFCCLSTTFDLRYWYYHFIDLFV